MSLVRRRVFFFSQPSPLVCCNDFKDGDIRGGQRLHWHSETPKTLTE